MRTTIHTLFALLIFSCIASAADKPTEQTQPASMGQQQILDSIRSTLEARGVGKQFLFIENLGTNTNPQNRLIFWTRTGARTQAVVIAPLPSKTGVKFIRIQSTGIAFLPSNHPRFGEIAAYMLDRNFVLNGNMFARDSNDGEIVLRADLPINGKINPAQFMRTLEAILKSAEKESARLANLIGSEAYTNSPLDKTNSAPSSWKFAKQNTTARKVTDEQVAR